jgi:adenosylhomocysteine nucleosidase
MLDINGLKIMTLIANSAEYGASMQSKNINPDFIGVGPIEATFHTTYLLMNAISAGNKPDIIFSVGTAGSHTLKQCGLYQINSISYRDMDASVFGFDVGVTPFADYDAEFKLPVLFDDMPTASLATGASVVGHDGFKNIDADCVDMESYAVKRVADFFNIPMIGLRGISDGHAPANGIATWEEYLDIIDVKIAEFYHHIMQNPNRLVLG